MGATEFYIGIEGVAMRRSVAALAARDGTVLGIAEIPQAIAMHTIPRNALRPRLFELIKKLAIVGNLSASDLNRHTTVCIGLTGVTFPYDAQVDLPREVAELRAIAADRLICTGDAEIIFAAYAGTDTGSAVLCHMGSTAYVSMATTRLRYGGWGPAFGDEGSGYDMGRSALRALGESYDRRDPDSILWAEVDRWLQSPTDPLDEWIDVSIAWQNRREEFLSRWTKTDMRTLLFAFAHDIAREKGHTFWWNFVSGLVIPVMNAYERESSEDIPLTDRIATRIVEGAVSKLVCQYRQAIALVDSDHQQLIRTSPLVIAGGVVNHHPKFRDLLAGSIVRECSITGDVVFRETPRAMRPVFGALLFALGNANGNSLRLPERDVSDRIRKHARAAFPDRYQE